MNKYPMMIVALLMVSFVFGAATSIVTYATGKDVAYTPKMMMVSHTEYRFSEAGQIIARIVDFQGNPVAVDSCNATILYPDKTTFVSFAGMTASVNISGDYYYSFTTPAGPEGTYEYQATCFYGANKNASVTNSFHLSGVTNTILGNLTEIDTTLTYVQGNLTQLSSDLFSVNASLAGQVSALSSQLNANMSTVFSNFGEIQSNFSTVFTEFTNVHSELSDINSTLVAEFANIQSNFSSVLAAINAIDNTLVLGNLTEIDAYLAQVLGNQTEIDSAISGVSGQITTFRAVYDGNVTAQNAMLALINDTTTNTYDYVTGTLTQNVDNVLTNLGVINATVNRIETTTNQINSTVNSILQNQQDQVHMSVFSG